jgi:hypothetical protein
LLTRIGVKYENFSIPFSLSAVSDIEHFVAREDELREIHKALSGDGSWHTIVLHGLGGIGKTQLAIAYAKRHKDNYSAIFWLNIKDEDSLKQSFARVARQILREYPSARGLSNIDMKNLDDVIDAVKAWLSLPYNTRWLTIYDNYDNPRLASNTDPAAVDIAKFLPEVYQGSVLVTTRSSEVEISHLIQVTKLVDVRDSLEILSNTSRREGLMHGKHYLYAIIFVLIFVLDTDAARLATKLGGHPLALATAGAYLKQASIGLSDYLRLYEKSWAKLRKTSPELSSCEDRMLYSTWQISFEHVKRRNICSAHLLRLWAYFDNQDLWFELLQHSDSKDPHWIRELVKDELTFHGAMRILSDHGLVKVNKSSQELLESQGYSIHGCVHSWTVHVLNQEWNYDLARVALNSVALHVPGEQANRPWLTQLRLLQHAARCSHIVLNGLVRDDGMAGTYLSLGYLFNDQSKLVEAEQMYERALQGNEKALGAEHNVSSLRKTKASHDLDVGLPLHSSSSNPGRAAEIVQDSPKASECQEDLGESVCDDSSAGESVEMEYDDFGVDTPSKMRDTCMSSVMDPVSQGILHRFMNEFWILINQDWTADCTQNGNDSSQSHTTTSGDIASSQPSTQQTSTAKRGRDNDRELPPDENGDERRRRPKTGPMPLLNTKTPKLFACPFRKHWPQKYNLLHYRACVEGCFDSISRVKYVIACFLFRLDLPATENILRENTKA